MIKGAETSAICSPFSSLASLLILVYDRGAFINNLTLKHKSNLLRSNLP